MEILFQPYQAKFDFSLSYQAKEHKGRMEICPGLSYFSLSYQRKECKGRMEILFRPFLILLFLQRSHTEGIK